MEKLKQFIYWLSKTDYDALEYCTPSAKMNQFSLGIMVLFTGLMALLSGSFALYTVFNNALISAVVGLLYAMMIMSFDREIVAVNDKRAALFRLPLAILIGFIVAVPIELRILQDRIDQELVRQNKVENRELFERITQAEKSYNERRKKIESDMEKYRNEAYKWGKAMEAEAVGRVITGRTGIAGYGAAYNEAKRQKEMAEKLLSDAQAQLQNLEQSSIKEISRLRDDYKNEKIAQVYGLLSRIEALESIKEHSNPAFWMAWGIRLLFIMIEIFPALLKLFLPYNEYHAILETTRRTSIQRIHAIGNEKLIEIERDPFTKHEPTLRQNLLDNPLVS